ncbi:unnamed protein product [Rhodiola kirilowii]
MSKNKIHPCKRWSSASRTLEEKNQKDDEEAAIGKGCCCSESASVLTVWKKSSMGFQGTDGFTVFDECGKLCFRVENYTRYKQGRFGINGGCGALVLMDGAGKPLLTLKPQLFSLQHRWNAYRGIDCNSDRSQRLQPFVFSMRKKSMFAHQNEADVFMGDAKSPDFRIEGSFRRRSCKIKRFEDGEVIARISRKKVSNMTVVLLSDEVFSLVVAPGFSRELVMGFVLVLDRICGNKYIPSLC